MSHKKHIPVSQANKAILADATRDALKNYGVYYPERYPERYPENKDRRLVPCTVLCLLRNKIFFPKSSSEELIQCMRTAYIQAQWYAQCKRDEEALETYEGAMEIAKGYGLENELFEICKEIGLHPSLTNIGRSEMQTLEKELGWG